MYIKQPTSAFILLLFLVNAAYAQPIDYDRDIGFTVGANVPLSDGETDVIMGVTYGQYYYNGCGFRVGVQYSPYVLNVDNYFGIPIAFSYRTRLKNSDDRLQLGMSAATNTYYDNLSMYDKPSGQSIAASFLFFLFSQVEFFAGVTPGYVTGKGDGNVWLTASYPKYTEKPQSFSLSLDAGASFNYKIWRFDLKLIPAFHYYLTTNYVVHKIDIDQYNGTMKGIKEKPQKWFFTISGGLTFKY